MRRYGIGIAAIALIAVGLAIYVWQRSDTGGERADPVPPRSTKPVTTRDAREPSGLWPTYGFDAQRTRFAPGVQLRPPLRRIWTFRGRALLEFPPALAQGRVFQPTFDGRLYALDATTGRTLWRYESGRCAWASPHVARGVVYEAFLNRKTNCDARTNELGGEVVAFDAMSGRIRWRREIGPTESSPLLAAGHLFVGDWLGQVHALDPDTGRVRWTRTTGGPVKGSVAAAGGRVYIGSYDGRVYAFAGRTGRELWRAGPGTGAFYSTPAVDHGRIFIGSTNGSVYALDALRGNIRWTFRTGGYVYSSPAVWRGRVLIGSYDKNLYAIDAQTGSEQWRFPANGPISGSPTVLDGVVWFSTLNERTYALDAATGKLLWTFPDGKYSPVVADSERIYLVGNGRLYGMVER